MKLGDKNGMVMALSLFYRSSNLVLVAAYENGLVTVGQLDSADTWEVTYREKTHSQPILSLDVSRDKDYFFTSSADAIIVKHPIPLASEQQHQRRAPEKPTQGASLLSEALASQPNPEQPTNAHSTGVTMQTEPLKAVNTKHSGQQSLKIRSDSRIFATAGWDSKIRVYSAKTMKEVAVLKWHQVGCYTVAFSSLDDETGDQSTAGSEPSRTQADIPTSTAVTAVPKLVDLSVRDKRIKQAKTAHWLAAGSKDGKVSLWDVF